MKKINRVVANKDFSRIVKEGKTLKSNSFTVHFVESDKNRTCIGVSASTKLGNAVVRNRIRRQIRSMCDSICDYQKQSFDLIVIARSGYLSNNYDENFASLTKLFKSIGIN